MNSRAVQFGLLWALVASGILALLSSCMHPAPRAESAIAAAVNSPLRPAADRERDAGSKPAAVLAFIGIAPGMAVLDFNAATGYYTELLSRVVGTRGHVIAHNHPGAVRMLRAEDFEQRFGQQRLPNTEQLLARHNELHLAPRSLDAVLMSMVYHDTYWYDPKVDWGPVDRPALLAALYQALKPGGVVGVIDHHAVAGADPRESVMALHRIDAAVVRRDFLKAGFVLEAESDILRNGADDHTHGVFDSVVHGKTDRFVMRFRKPAGWDLPASVPPPRVPADSPMTPERVALGRHLFYDQRLSGNGTQSCASCHLQSLAFTDGRAQGLGSTGELHPRGPMSLVNAAYRDALTWANPTLTTLEVQVLVPLLGTTPVELGLAGHEQQVYAALARDRTYAKLFAAAFPGERAPITTPHVAQSLAAFVRSIVSFRSPFDRYRFDHDTTALSPDAERGMRLFLGKARCGGCHMAQNVTVDLGLNIDGGSKTANSPATDPAVFMFHNTGLYNLAGPLSYPADNTGLHAHTGNPADVGRFRIPSLRDVALTAPYMHDGSIATLEQVLDHYVAGGRSPNPALLSTSIKPLSLSADERHDLLAYLGSLTDEAALRDPRWSNPWCSIRPATTSTP